VPGASARGGTLPPSDDRRLGLSRWWRSGAYGPA